MVVGDVVLLVAFDRQFFVWRLSEVRPADAAPQSKSSSFGTPYAFQKREGGKEGGKEREQQGERKEHNGPE